MRRHGRLRAGEQPPHGEAGCRRIRGLQAFRHALIGLKIALAAVGRIALADFDGQREAHHAVFWREHRDEGKGQRDGFPGLQVSDRGRRNTLLVRFNHHGSVARVAGRLVLRLSLAFFERPGDKASAANVGGKLREDG